MSVNRRCRAKRNALVAARIGQTSNTNQAEAPSLGGNSSAVADQSSASDLVGIGINPLEIPKESDEIERVTHAITINPYLVYAGLFSPDDPLRPNVYRERVAEVLRKFSVTVGFEELRKERTTASMSMLWGTPSVGPEGIVITKHGKPVAKLVPVASESRDLLGAWRGKLRITGDVRSTGLRWDAES